jgi:hypothetical protein
MIVAHDPLCPRDHGIRCFQSLRQRREHSLSGLSATIRHPHNVSVSGQRRQCPGVDEHGIGAAWRDINNESLGETRRTIAGIKPSQFRTGVATTKVSTERPEFRIASGKRRHTQALAYAIEEIKHALVTDLKGWAKLRLMPPAHASTQATPTLKATAPLETAAESCRRLVFNRRTNQRRSTSIFGAQIM